MQLPGANEAIVRLEKLRDYCLNLDHPRGRHKARVFRAALDLTSGNASILRAALIAAAREGDASLLGESEFGQQYRIDFDMTNAGRTATVRSLWIVLPDEIAPRLTTCYVL